MGHVFKDENGATIDEPRKFSGQIECTYTNGDIYSGPFIKGQKNGFGNYRAANGVTYEGNYLLGKRSGVGILTFSHDSSYYHGHFVENKRQGYGYCKYPNGDAYSGNWADNLRSGVGTYWFAASKTYMRGRWEKGQMVEGVWRIPHWGSLEASFKNNMPCGQSKWILKSSDSPIYGVYGEITKPSIESEDNNNNDYDDEFLNIRDPPMKSHLTWRWVSPQIPKLVGIYPNS